ncbi:MULTISPECIES: hypothetical protein [unclassified Sporosarcina]|nr:MULTISPECIES: hypothetical protein [unclassified Sporosarcina]
MKKAEYPCGEIQLAEECQCEQQAAHNNQSEQDLLKASIYL